MTQAEIMREKQRKADLKKQGIVEEEEDNKPKKEVDLSFLKQFGGLEFDDEEESKNNQEEEKKQSEDEVIQSKGKKGKK